MHAPKCQLVSVGAQQSQTVYLYTEFAELFLQLKQHHDGGAGELSNGAAAGKFGQMSRKETLRGCSLEEERMRS